MAAEDTQNHNTEDPDRPRGTGEVIQINLNNSPGALDLLKVTATETRAKLAIVSEPPKNMGAGRWYASADAKAAILVFDRDLPAQRIGGDKGWVTALVGTTEYTSCYFSPNATTREFVRYLTEVRRHQPERDEGGMRGARSRRIIAGDLNAWSTEWGSRREDAKGKRLRETMADMGLRSCNTGNTPTFRQGERSSVVDVTFATANIAGRIRDTWAVDETTETLSDHRYVTFREPGRPQRPAEGMDTRRREGGAERQGWCLKKFKADRFRDSMRKSTRPPREGGVADTDRGRTPEELAAKLRARIEEACDAAAPRKKTYQGKRSAYWWSEETAEARRRCTAARRRLQRTRPRPGSTVTEQREEEYRRAKKQMRIVIRREKEKAWKGMLDKIEKDPWGMPYKVCMGKLRPRQVLHRKTVEEAVEKLFPDGEGQPHEPAANQTEGAHEGANPTTDAERETPEVTTEEVTRAIKKAKTNKAPGPDNLPNEIMKLAFECDPEAFRLLYDECMRRGEVPRQWKEAKLVLLPKGGQGVSLRPICLLNAIAKAFEKIVLHRLEDHLEKVKGISDEQYGFRRGKTTIDAILELQRRIRVNSGQGKSSVAIALDIKNAFNTASWRKIVETLKEKNTPAYMRRVVASYLSERSLYQDTREGRVWKEITRGVPQGSVLGPLLWNTMFNGALEVTLPAGAVSMCYADDTIILASGRSITEARNQASAAAERVITWIEKAGLEVARQKTVAVAFGRKRLHPEIEEEGLLLKGKTGSEENKERIPWSDSLRYLGVIIHRTQKHSMHVRKAAEKARGVATALARLMPNVGGPRQARRRLLGRVPEATMLYAAPAWASAMKYANSRETVNAAQRDATRREICAYKTISAEAAAAIAGTPPAHLLITERARLWKRRLASLGRPDARILQRSAKEEEREETVRQWQREWNVTTKGKWTRTLIPDLRRWINRKGEVSYHLTQAMSGHGCFNAFLHKIGKRTTRRCYHCGDPEDDAEHAIFRCEEGADLRRNSLHDRDGTPLTPGTITNEMLRSKDSWKRIKKGIEDIVRRKEETEKRHEAAQAARAAYGRQP